MFSILPTKNIRSRQNDVTTKRIFTIIGVYFTNILSLLNPSKETFICCLIFFSFMCVG